MASSPTDPSAAATATATAPQAHAAAQQQHPGNTPSADRTDSPPDEHHAHHCHLPDRLRTLTLDESQPDVRLAISALSSMRSSTWSSPGSAIQPTSSDAASFAARSSASPLPRRTDLRLDLERDTPYTTVDSSVAGESTSAPDSVAASHKDDQSEAQIEVDGIDEEGIGAHPIVRSTLNAFEQAKQKSRLVKLGANLVGSIGRPVISKVGDVLGEANLQHIDGYARRQLDWILPSGEPNALPDPTTVSDTEVEAQLSRVLAADERQALEASMQPQLLSLPSEDKHLRRRAILLHVLQTRLQQVSLTSAASGSSHPSGLAASTFAGPTETGPSSRHPHLIRTHPHAAHPYPRSRSHHPSSSSGLRYRGSHSRAPSAAGSTSVVPPEQGLSRPLAEQSVAQVAAGKLSGAMASSPESIKSLKYCLKWLQYATAHMEHHITSLRDLMVQSNHGYEAGRSKATGTTPMDTDPEGKSAEPFNAVGTGTPGAEENLTQIKGDVVGTIRNVVEVVSKYAGAALPGPARNTVRGFILALPSRWASVNTTPPQAEPQPDAQAATKVFTLAVESLDVLRSVTVVFGESLDRVDAWMDHLRQVGLQRKHALEATAGQAQIQAQADALHIPRTHESAFPSSSVRASSPGASEVSASTSVGSKRRRTRPRPRSVLDSSTSSTTSFPVSRSLSRGSPGTSSPLAGITPLVSSSGTNPSVPQATFDPHLPATVTAVGSLSAPSTPHARRRAASSADER